MPKTLPEWIETEVVPVREKSIQWLSERHFFRDPVRPIYSDIQYFFSPADGIVLYCTTVAPEESILEIKGRQYSLQDALRMDSFDKRSLVIGIFMTFYDVHVNRIPFPGRVSYRELDPIDSHNYPMLAVEKDLVNNLRINTGGAGYLHNNQRVINTVYAPSLGQSYYILQVADYDVDSITPFRLKQNWPFAQNQRFSQIRYGSQVDLILPLSDRFDFVPCVESGLHVEAGIDALVEVRDRS